MVALVVPDQSAALAAAGVVAPKLGDFVPGVPLGGGSAGYDLVEVWRSRSGLALASGKASAWAGYNGRVARQVDTTKQPLASTAGVDFSGTGDYLATDMAAASTGYLVAKIKKKVIGANGLIVGGTQSAAAPSQRISMGFSTANRFGANIGSRVLTGFVGTTTFAMDQVAVVGLVWDGTNARLRVNGTEEATQVYNVSGAGIGNAPLWMGGANQVGLSTETGDTLIALAAYSGIPTNDDLAAIDAAMAAFAAS